jgi:uncharacterized membrane protein
MQGVLRKLQSHTIFWPLLVSSLLSAVLFACRMWGGGTTRYWFLLWNLLLAWVPLLLAWWLAIRLRTTGWMNWPNVLVTAAWLLFLPNSFYLVSDFVHLEATGEVSLLFDVVMFMSFAWNGLLLGFAAVLLVHRELLRRVRTRLSGQLVAMVFILCSFAIYLGRYLGWNSWDIIFNPAGIIFHLSDRLVSPASYPNTFTTTTFFTIALGAMYYTVFRLVAAIRGESHRVN